MKPVSRKLTALMVIFSMAFSSIGCTTMKPILLTKPGDVTKQIKAGDTIQYRTAFGETETLKVTSVSAEVLKGTYKGQVKEVKIADVKFIGKREIDTVGTSLIAGVVLLVLSAVVGGSVDTGPKGL